MEYANKLLKRFSLTADRLYWLNAGLLLASAVVYGLFAVMTAQQNNLTLLALLNRSLPTVTMLLMVLLNAVLALILIRFRTSLITTSNRLRVLMMIQVCQQFLCLNPVLVLSALGVVISTPTRTHTRFGWPFWLLISTLTLGYLLVAVLRIAIH